MSRNVPKLRFKGFEDEWKEKKMALLGTFLKGNGISKSDLSESGKECILYGELYTTYGEVIESIKSKTDISLKNEVLSKINDVIIPSSGESAIDIATASCVMKDNILLGGDLNVFRSNKDNGVFISYQLNNSKKKDIAKIAQGASVVHIYNEQLKQLKVNIPSLQEQEKIANFLSKVDSIIEKQEKKVEYWNSYKKGMMQKIFSQKIRFKDENGMDYPEWKINKIENIATIEMGFTPSTKNDEAWNGNIEWLSIAGMNSKYIYSGNKKISSEILGKRKLVPIDTLIMSFKLTIGRLAIVKKEIVTNEAICQFYWKSKDISNEYMYAYLSVINIESFGCRAAKGITLNTESLNSIVVKLPCLEEQTKIANFLSNIDNIIEKESKKLEELKQWKKGLLQQMFV
ncbi:TPA: restriction endonuclease subunit S [Clostridium perfringens]|nr:restriction endonuclease subunit S [Clostridium perfringens]